MTETQKRIKAYKAALPGLRERVVAVALLLAMSLAMMTSASFAWLTISRSPEVTGVNTTIASNGNLEIALATGDGKTPPDESKVGDSSAAKGQNIFTANQTWGNLINLADPAYGLDHLVLRPAQLNTAALLTKPLYGAVYSSDGRIKTLTTNYGYTAWIPAEGNIKEHFGVSNDVGVRAISSIKREQTGFAGDYAEAYEAADIANVNAANTFVAITKNEDWRNVLAKLMGTHMTATLNSEEKYINASISTEEMEAMIAMYEEFVRAHVLEAEAIAQLLNLELFAAHGGDTTAYSPFSVDDILAIQYSSDRRIDQSNGDFSYEVTTSKGVKTIKITNLRAFLKDYNMLQSDLATLKAIYESKDFRWTASGLAKVVANLMVVDDCLIKKTSESQYQTVKALMSSFSGMGALSALSYKDCDIIVTNGVLYNLEQRVGSTVSITGLKVTATKNVDTMNLGEQTMEISTNITTSASKPSNFKMDLDYTSKTLNTGADTSSGEEVAEDTYALAVDFWVRTNAANSYLTLEGNVLLGEAYEVPVMTLDASGNQVPLYGLTKIYKDEESGETYTDEWDLYKKEENGKVTWYKAVSHTPMTEEELGDDVPVAQVEEKRDVIGYEGENRVWDKSDKDYITVDSTTQGVGSCYVYYADTPEDQARSLELLKSLSVAFVDSEGTLLATASMDTENFYGESGRFVVPLKVNNDGITIKTTDESGNEVVEYAITALQKNEPTRITAIVFLDGRDLGNEDVLSAADIQGQLNIQFGSNTEMEPIGNEKLEYETRVVTASVDNTSFDYDTHVGDMISNVTVHVDGAEPTNVKAFFVRKINATQGSREEEMTFTKNASGDWVTSYTFTAPGVYILRSVYLDGVEYVLKNAPEVTINGFTIASLNCEQVTEGRHVDVLTAANSAKLDLTLKFTSDDEEKIPDTVQGRFLRNSDGAAVNINFTYNATTHIWSGSGTFLNSGEYTMQYLVLDGETTGLEESMWITANIKLGMKTAVYTKDITSFKFKPDEMVANGTDQLQMQVKIMDNSGGELIGLQNVKLTYRLKNSASTIDVDLTWNGKDYYEGDIEALSAGPGIWVFDKVTVGGNTITTATASPVFEMLSPEPPSYSGIGGTGMQYRPNGDASLTVTLKYSATATVAAVFKDSSGNRYPVIGTAGGTDSDNVTTWNFAVPTNNGKQDGYWTLETAYLWNYYETDGDYVEWEKDEKGNLKGELALNPDGSLAENANRDDENAMVIDIKSANNGSEYTVKVVQTITVTFDQNLSQNKSQTFGKSGDTVTGTFMQAHTISGVTVTIRDFEGAVEGAGNVTLVYSYAGDSQEKGGYTGGDDTYTGFTMTLKQDATDKTKFVQDGTVTLRAAGTYTVTGFEFTISGNQKYNTIPATAPAYAVWSKAPTAKITARTNYGSSTHTDTSATVYYNYSEGNGCTSYNNYTQPTVTITLADSGNASGASIQFVKSDGGTVHLYTGNGGTSAVDTYSWTGNGTCLRWIGYYKNVRAGNDERTAAGTLTATKMILTYNGYTYEVDIPDITISNPS